MMANAKVCDRCAQTYPDKQIKPGGIYVIPIKHKEFFEVCTPCAGQLGIDEESKKAKLDEARKLLEAAGEIKKEVKEDEQVEPKPN